MPPSDDGLPFKYRNSDGASCSTPGGDDRGYCSQGAGGELPDSGSTLNYTGGAVVWNQIVPIPICAHPIP